MYLGNPEDLRGGVGDIFARKVMQISNLETVFESGQIFCTARVQKCEIFEKVEYLQGHEKLGFDNGTVMFSGRSPIRRRNNF